MVRPIAWLANYDRLLEHVRSTHEFLGWDTETYRRLRSMGGTA
jgi:hypothetical protein